MKNKTKDTLKDITVVVASGLGAFAAKKSIDKIYAKKTQEEPPKTIEGNRKPFVRILGYTLLTSFVGGMARLLVRDRVTHHLEQ